MNSWRAVGAIVAFELRREWGGVLITGLFAAYFGVIFIGLDDPTDASGNAKHFLVTMTNWIYLFGFPLFGSPMSRNSFHCWRDDPFSKKIAHWRTLPIPLPTILVARFLQTAAIMIVIGGLFAAAEYLLHSRVRDLATPAEWAATTVVWMAYGLIVQILYIYLELGWSGKIYVKWYLAFNAAGFLLVGFAGWHGVNIFTGLADKVAAHPVSIPIAALAVLAIALGAGYRLAIARMRRRRYTF
ncbi:hypothetical protein [Cohnella zeiphila]|uniref:ABC transporter permease n=1 Tax=Cohnella zeiphila TaxID=2761120 RepID=A0A7X0VUC4_9BACL|nr:hypothetical protein [Cohnella zeiphila]MBB6730117.1 hypothetical protein [Cohnella zeiphila]